MRRFSASAGGNPQSTKMFAEQERQTAVSPEDGAFEGGDQFDLVQPPMAPDIVQEGLLKEHRPPLGRGGRAALERELAQRVHDGGAIHALGAAGGARLTGDTLPDGAGAQRGLAVAELQQADQARRRNVHLPGGGASGRALAALVALRQPLPASFQVRGWPVPYRGVVAIDPLKYSDIET